jgi:hypothetical protein
MYRARSRRFGICRAKDVIELRAELDANLTLYYDKVGLFAPD